MSLMILHIFDAFDFGLSKLQNDFCFVSLNSLVKTNNLSFPNRISCERKVDSNKKAQTENWNIGKILQRNKLYLNDNL